MTTEKMKWIEAYLQAKTGDENKDVDQALVHYWKPFTDEDIREVAFQTINGVEFTGNDILRYCDKKYGYMDEYKHLLLEFGLTVRVNGEYYAGVVASKEEYLSNKDSDKISEMYCNLNNFLRENVVEKKTWNKFFKWYNQFGYNLHFKDIVGKQSWEIISKLEDNGFFLYKAQNDIPGENLGDLQNHFNLFSLEKITEWFEANVDGYKEFED